LPSHHDGALLLSASLVAAVLALASLNLLRMLTRLGRLPYEGAAP
jgi:hypothetical protein